VQAVLEQDEYRAFAARYGLDRSPNFEGKWYPHTFTPLDVLCNKLSLDEATLNTLLERSRRKLFAAREQRLRPGRDEKVLTSWNALMIRGMAIAGRALQRDEWIESARRALDYLQTHHWHNGRLLATSKDGTAHLDAYLDDYVFLVDAILELQQHSWRDGELDFARQLADVVLDHFADQDNGGFFFTADDHERLIERPKPAGDDSMPSGNGIAALALARLGHLLADSRYTDAAENTLRAMWPSIADLPYAHTALLLALQEYLSPPDMIILRGPADEVSVWQRDCQCDYSPARLCFPIPNGATMLPGLLADRPAADQVQAWICSGTECRPPVSNREELDQYLSG
jgi:hypothetical protein